MKDVKPHRKILVLCFILSAHPALADAKVWNFDKDKPGSLPPGWLSEHTGEGTAGTWRVMADSSAPSRPNVLAQTSADPISNRFPLAVVENTNYADVDLSVRFKAISGKEDQAAGMVWRNRDARNYYIVRANSLEGNVVLYKVENGKRSHLKPKGAQGRGYGVNLAVPGNTWHKLSVKVTGNHFVVSLNDQKLFEVEDNTFSKPGKIGLWTKADSVTHFDDLMVDGK